MAGFGCISSPKKSSPPIPVTVGQFQGSDQERGGQEGKGQSLAKLHKLSALGYHSLIGGIISQFNVLICFSPVCGANDKMFDLE